MLFDLNIEDRITDKIIDFDIPVQKGYVKRYSSWLSGMMG